MRRQKFSWFFAPMHERQTVCHNDAAAERDEAWFPTTPTLLKRANHLGTFIPALGTILKFKPVQTMTPYYKNVFSFIYIHVCSLVISQ